MRSRTRAVHAGQVAPTPGGPAPSSPALDQATARLFHSLDDVEAAYEGGEPLYRRYGGPNHAALEQAMVALERPDGPAGERELRGLATGSGMAAIHLACVALSARRGKLVAARQSYGGTLHLFTDHLPSMGREAILVDIDDPAAVRHALTDADLLVVETITNPTMSVPDLPALAAAAHDAGALLMVDNTFASPVLCRPLAHGADIVMHSTTKYVGGHGDTLGGVLVYGAEHDPTLRAASQVFGPSPGPLDLWLALRGLRTMALRVRAASESALRIARWLEGDPRVNTVHYPGLDTHPSHAVAVRLLEDGYGGMLSFDLGDGPRAAALLRRLRLIPIMPSLADVATTISYPLATSHRGLPASDLARDGVTPGMVRLSVGIEDVEDLLEDIDQALGAPPA